MNTPKHTPGPWEVTGPHSREVITTNPSTYKPCMTIAKVRGYWDGEAQANAHLIAAAPAMYAVLKEAFYALSYHMPDRFDDEEQECAWHQRILKIEQVLAQVESKS